MSQRVDFKFSMESSLDPLLAASSLTVFSYMSFIYFRKIVMSVFCIMYIIENGIFTEDRLERTDITE